MKPHRMKSFSRIRRQNVGGQSEIWEEIRPWMRDVAAFMWSALSRMFHAVLKMVNVRN